MWDLFLEPRLGSALIARILLIEIRALLESQIIHESKRGRVTRATANCAILITEKRLRGNSASIIMKDIAAAETLNEY
jgi:hypothetical protein